MINAIAAPSFLKKGIKIISPKILTRKSDRKYEKYFFQLPYGKMNAP